MRRFGLIGERLEYSFSKKYFTRKFEVEGITDAQYDLFELETIHKLPELLSRYSNFSGLNVTVPYKEQVIPFLDSLQAEAAEVKAVNTIIFKNGKLIGANSDVAGFQRSLAAVLKPHHERAIILGTGGASKAVSYALKTIGIDHLFVSRNPKEEDLSYKKVNEYVIKHHPLIINTTPLGTFPNVKEAPEIPYQFLTDKHLLYDLVYNPEVSQFLANGKSKGAATLNGHRMLVLQAEKSWELWNR